ncbi:hypothetical protein NQ315_016714 [Exocentrus adspersus]|uniref:Peptidase aspartic putative domain-containing protein n=1 Tax=Exocentrus adspersus TaxID=1586481 RepID=A0AAV8VF42_9CUCU|nr:hypothetical protein NQ315_016714 [Exocentrus adspersus]
MEDTKIIQLRSQAEKSGTRTRMLSCHMGSSGSQMDPRHLRVLGPVSGACVLGWNSVSPWTRSIVEFFVDYLLRRQTNSTRFYKLSNGMPQKSTYACNCYKASTKKLLAIDNKICEELLAESGEEDLSAEITACDEYKHRLLQLRSKCTTVKFNDDIKVWLPFWAQFKKIHDDGDIDPSDKIAYLSQATVPGSRARRIVDNFPPVPENYKKIVDCLASSGNCSVSVLYDEIESQLRSLETPGITSDKYATMLYPLIESCLPDNLIRVYQKFAGRFADSGSASVDGEDPIEEGRVENEQKFALAAEGFGIKGDPEAVISHRKKSQSEKPVASVSTAAGLVNCDFVKCVFCGGSHDNESCFKARTMNLEQKRELLPKGKSATKQVRALVDTSSQNSYILQSTARKLGLESLKEERIVHALFGGRSMSEQRHNCYRVEVSGEEFNYCSMEDQSVICKQIPQVTDGPWSEEFKAMNIALTDVVNSGPIEILFGADVIGKLYTRRKHELNCGLFAIETLFGWTLIGRIPLKYPRCDAVMTVFSLFAKEVKVTDLGAPSVLGITDPVENRPKQQKANETKEFFEETTRMEEAKMDPRGWEFSNCCSVTKTAPVLGLVWNALVS